MQTPWYNRYNTQLNDEERKGLYQFLMDLSMREGRNAYNDLNDYDMAGAYKANMIERLPTGFFFDTFKKPNHPVFSTDSIYSGVDGYEGGYWTEGSPDVPGGTFFPSEWNLQNMPPEEMIRYFKAREPNAHLVLPGEGQDTEQVFYKGNFSDGGNDDMAVYYANNNRGGGLGNGLGIVGTLLSFVPGMQGVGAGMGAIGSALNGNYVGAAKSLIGANAGNAAQAATNPTANTLSASLGADINSPDYWQKAYQNYRLGRN